MSCGHYSKYLLTLALEIYLYITDMQLYMGYHVKSMLLLLVNTDNINYLTRLPTDQNYECYGC